MDTPKDLDAQIEALKATLKTVELERDSYAEQLKDAQAKLEKARVRFQVLREVAIADVARIGQMAKEVLATRRQLSSEEVSDLISSITSLPARAITEPQLADTVQKLQVEVDRALESSGLTLEPPHIAEERVYCLRRYNETADRFGSMIDLLIEERAKAGAGRRSEAIREFKSNLIGLKRKLEAPRDPWFADVVANSAVGFAHGRFIKDLDRLLAELDQG